MNEELKPDTELELRKLRKVLWLFHGCSYEKLYGDDGELYCGQCHVDFKRDNMDRVYALLMNKRMEEYPISKNPKF